MAPPCEEITLNDTIASDHDSSEITVIDISFIKPNIPTKTADQHLFLASLDLHWTEFFYNRRLLFYAVPLHQQAFMVEKLKSSLSKVLVAFYPAAGRLAAGPDGRIGIDCNDQGVEFVDTTVDVSFAQLEKSNFQPCPFFNKLARWPEHDLSKNKEMPLLSIQVTRFSSGGLSLGYAHSHVLADGHSMWHFMNSWAECAREEPISVFPVHDRTPFKAEAPSEEIAAKLNLPPPKRDAGGDVGAPKTKEPLQERLFHASLEVIDKLKQDAGGQFSSYEVVCAHFWKTVVKARDLEDEQMVGLGVLANMRSRMNPSLPQGYFGNAILFTFAVSFASELARENFTTSVSRVHHAALECNLPNLWALVHWLELRRNLFGSRLQLDLSSMTVASSPKFRMYAVDFGLGGPPLAIRCARINSDGEMVLFPGRHGGIDVCMPLTEAAMCRLLHDPKFLPS